MDIRRGAVKSFDSDTHLAGVQIAGSLSVWLEDVPVAANIAEADVEEAQSCAFLFFDGANPSDAVVIAVWA